MKKKILISIVCFFCLQVYAQEDTARYKHSELEIIINNIQQDFVPDKRIKIYDIKVDESRQQPTLTGVTSDITAYDELTKQAEAIYGDAFINNIKLLPDTALGEKVYGVINLSVADIRERASFSSGMATQALLGTPIRIWQKEGWYRIQTPDGYLGWSQAANFQAMTKEEFNNWIDTPKIIFTDYFGFSYSKPDKDSQTISDLSMGNILKYEGEKGKFYIASYPDGKKAYILKSQCELYDKWFPSLKLTGKSIVKKAFTMMGIPYVWGGTSVKGMDCSGFTKMMFFMYGVILTRDASQQVNTGIPVDIKNGYQNLKEGDLLFFGKVDEKTGKERIRHVGFYIGNNEFIHASGYIRISSLDPQKDNYDELNATEFVRASRIIGAVGTKGIWAIDNNPFYHKVK